MSRPESDPTYEVALYIEHAHEMLEVAAHNIAAGFYGSAINRAYYAIFYAANALLKTLGISHTKHSGVIASFRRYFVKPGIIEAEYSDIYGRVMENRHVSDYEIELPVDAQVAEDDIRDSHRFVERVASHLREEGWL